MQAFEIGKIIKDALDLGNRYFDIETEDTLYQKVRFGRFAMEWRLGTPELCLLQVGEPGNEVDIYGHKIRWIAPSK